MGIFDWYTSGPSTSAVRGANNIPPPRSDASVNTPPPAQHQRVIDFVREAPTARYTFDSRLNRDEPDCQLCRIDPQGGKSCIKLALHSASLFKSMQQLGFYCALPAEPTRTEMECNRVVR